MKSSDNFLPPETFCTCVLFILNVQSITIVKAAALCSLQDIGAFGLFLVPAQEQYQQIDEELACTPERQAGGLCLGPPNPWRCCFSTLVHPLHGTSPGLQSVQSS